MTVPRIAALFGAAVLTACHTYTPEPVDLGAHARAFAARLPDAIPLPAGDPARQGIDLTDGLDLREGRLVAMCFHPECRAARAAVGVATAERDHAGAMPDPELSLDLMRILESVPHRWLAGAGLAFTVPWTGRRSLQRDLANAARDGAVLQAIASELASADALDEAWLHWSGDRAKAELLAELCDRLRELAAIAERLAAAGALTNQGARVFLLEQKRREHELAAAKDAAARGELVCRQRLGLHPAAAVVLVPTRTVTPRLADAALRAATVGTSARVLAAQDRHRVSEAELALAVRRQWPDLTLGPRWQEEDAQPRLGLGFSLPIPLFAGNDGPIARATAARAAAAEALRASLEVASQELAIAELHLQQTTRQRQFVHDEMVPMADRQLRDGKALAQAGQLDPLLLLDAIVRAHDTHLLLLDAEVQQALAAIAVNRCSALPDLLPAAPDSPASPR